MVTYDVAVLGGGPGGYVAALRAAKRGAHTCCIEAADIGGVCLNTGCIPTKAMLHASEVFRHIQRAPEYGFSAGTPTVDGAAYMHRVAEVVTGIRKAVEKLLKARKVDVIRGRGRLAARDRIAVEGPAGPQEIQTKAIIIATGSRPVRPAFLPWDSGRIGTTDEATTAQRLPESILIMGGGIIGCEFATMFSELGIPTTVVEMLDRLAATVDVDASKAIAKSLEKRGVTIRTGARIAGMKATGDGIVAELADGHTLAAAGALVAVGRAPNVEDIGLETVGVQLAGKVIGVDDRCRTSVENMYAIGDCAEVRQFAHLASRMGVVAADNATGHTETRDPRTVIPVGVYTHPEVAAVGLSEAEAGAAGAAGAGGAGGAAGEGIRIARFFYQGSGMARAYGDTEGQVKLIARTPSGEILGALVIGQHATDVIQEIATAMRNGLTVEQVAGTIHPHPTFVEGVLEAAEAWIGFPIHAIG